MDESRENEGEREECPWLLAKEILSIDEKGG
jgi:hypothetical protein